MAIRRKSDLEQLIIDIHEHGINYHTREIYLHSFQVPNTDDEEPGVDYRQSTQFIKNLHILDRQNANPILVHMHTPGGDWNHGMAIYDSIRFSKSPITILSYSHASSMSGIILQAADRRVLMPNCEVMIHHGSLSLSGTTIAVASYVDLSHCYRRKMLEIFAARAINGSHFQSKNNITLDKVMREIDNKCKEKSDWFLNSSDAVIYGFADGILGQKGMENIDKIRIGRKIKL